MKVKTKKKKKTHLKLSENLLSSLNFDLACKHEQIPELQNSNFLSTLARSQSFPLSDNVIKLQPYLSLTAC